MMVLELGLGFGLKTSSNIQNAMDLGAGLGLKSWKGELMEFVPECGLTTYFWRVMEMRFGSRSINHSEKDLMELGLEFGAKN